MAILISGPHLQQSQPCAQILRALPEWFGIEDAIQQYIQEIDDLPTFTADTEGVFIGFLTLKHHNPYSAEIYVMGVLPDFHGRGAGRGLVKTAESYLRRRGTEFLQVKTLSEKHPDKNYAKTRSFYTKMGFKPLEELVHVWGSENPCLLMIKSLRYGKGSN